MLNTLFLPYIAHFISLFASLLLLPIFIVLARGLNFHDEPDGKLKKQKTKIPYLGGVAIYCAFMLALIFCFNFKSIDTSYFIALTLLLCVGLIDDLLTLTPLQKLVGQMFATLFFIKSGLFLQEELLFPYFNIFLSIFWFLTIINSINLVDVMDGLSSTLALFCMYAFGVFFYINHSYYPLIIVASLFGATLGFFFYNRPPAKIYMGDAGTLFIGGALASFPFFINWTSFSKCGLISPVLILFIPLLELFSLILIRTYKGIPFFNGSPDHFSIYLRNKGYSVCFILLFCFLLNCMLFLATMLFYYNYINIYLLMLFLATTLIFWFSFVI